MKKTTVLAAAACMSMIGCQPRQTSDETNKIQSVIVIAKDQSQSVDIDFSTKAVEQRIHAYLQTHCTTPNDVLLMQLHSYSNAATNHRLLSWKPYKAGTDANTDKELEQYRQKSFAKQQIKNIEQQVFTFLAEKTENNYTETAILELLPKIYEQTKGYKVVQIFFLSDMVQESSLSDFTKTGFPFPSKKAAMNKADEDSKLLQEKLHLLDNAFANVTDISILVPQNVTQDKLVFLDDYWAEIFRRYGFKGAISWQSL